jgi:hypothetical protein
LTEPLEALLPVHVSTEPEAIDYCYGQGWRAVGQNEIHGTAPFLLRERLATGFRLNRLFVKNHRLRIGRGQKPAERISTILAF